MFEDTSLTAMDTIDQDTSIPYALTDAGWEADTGPIPYVLTISGYGEAA